MGRLIPKWRRACNERDPPVRPGEAEGLSILVVMIRCRDLLVVVLYPFARAILEGDCLTCAVLFVRWQEVAARLVAFVITR